MLEMRSCTLPRFARLAIFLCASAAIVILAAAAEGAPLSPRDIVERAGAAVVMIEGISGEERRQGSGFLVSSGGDIVTNLHVVDRAKRVTVTFRDGTRLEEVAVRSFDVERDLVVLVVELPGHAVGWPALELGDSSALEPGDRILVIGSPLGLEQTVTDGIISAWREPKEAPDPDDYRDGASPTGLDLPRCRLLQISADITAGSSGGPVLNERAEVIGVASAGVSGASGLNFAVPVDELPRLLAETRLLDLDAFRGRVADLRFELARPYFERARITYEDGEQQSALRLAERALRLFPDFEEALLLAGRIGIETGQSDLAEKRLRAAVSVNEESVEGWYLLGLLYDRLAAVRGDSAILTQAEAIYRKVLDLDYRHGMANYRLAVIAIERGSLDEAEELLLASIESEPSNPDAHFALGEIYFSRMNYTNAKEEFEKALWEDDNHALSHFGLASVLMRIDSWPLSGADDHWEAFLRLSDGDPALRAQRDVALRIVERHFPHLLER